SSVITASLVGFYVSYKTEVENKVVSSENKEIESTRRDTLIENKESAQLPSISSPSQDVTNTPKVQLNTNPSNKISTSDQPISNSQNTENEVAPANTEETLEGTKEDPIAEEENSNKDNVQLELVSPKMNENPGVKSESKDHHKSFFDKKTAQLKDSARPLFVPKKK
ncbi:MAG: hypothetical protein K2Q22_02390, partial [Cytophagales bacterium]|nr:hypothetical protein [Cytophagales bacterium]